MSRLGAMPPWQKSFVQVGMLACSLTGGLYLLGHEFHLNKAVLGSHTVLAWHGIAAMLATLALGSVLPFHLKAGLKAKRKLISGVSQIGCLSLLLITAALLYYGSEDIRDLAITTHWIVGLLFFSCFIFHGVFTRNIVRAKAHLKRGA